MIPKHFKASHTKYESVCEKNKKTNQTVSFKTVDWCSLTERKRVGIKSTKYNWQIAMNCNVHVLDLRLQRSCKTPSSGRTTSAWTRVVDLRVFAISVSVFALTMLTYASVLAINKSLSDSAVSSCLLFPSILSLNVVGHVVHVVCFLFLSVPRCSSQRSSIFSLVPCVCCGPWGFPNFQHLLEVSIFSIELRPKNSGKNHRLVMQLRTKDHT